MLMQAPGSNMPESLNSETMKRCKKVLCFLIFFFQIISSPKDFDFLEGNVTKIFAKFYSKNFKTVREWRLFFLYFFSD